MAVGRPQGKVEPGQKEPFQVGDDFDALFGAVDASVRKS